MKYLILVLNIIAFFHSTSQVVSGLYSGKQANDSTKKIQAYELALSEYKGKITGFSYNTFISNDTFYYSVKRVKAEKKRNLLIVEDEQMLVNNFPSAPSKHVHQVNQILLGSDDTLREANGTWQTNKTKTYYSVHGNLEMKRDNDSAHSALIYHLKELNILPKEDQHIDLTEPKPKQNKLTVKSIPEKNNTTVTKTNPQILPYEKRKDNIMQTISVINDSLLLSFYDNGVIDGDSITVYLNGKNIISHKRLTAVASKKMIYIGNLGDIIQLQVVADNLGTIPPNTGLVIVKDGEAIYQVNFTADMQTNASIIFRKQKK